MSKMRTSMGQILAGTSLAMLLGMMPGCDSPPKGSSGGRIDSYTTTKSERSAEGANIAAMLEFSDVTAERLIGDISGIPEIKEAKARQILELGDILNKTQTPTTDFELLQRRLRGKLVRSKVATNNFKIVESARRMDLEKQRVTGDRDLLQEKSNAGDTNRYDANSTYVLQGDFMEARRGGRSQYYFEFKLTNLQSREIVFLESYDLGQTR